MLTVVWNPHGFHVVTMLLSGASINGLWFIDQNLVPVLDTSAHNARVTQNSVQYNPLKRHPQPGDSPDTSPADFCLFGKVKNALIGQEIPDEIALLEAAMEFLGGISGNELQAIFRN
jgi:hypothetical protein